MVTDSERVPLFPGGSMSDQPSSSAENLIKKQPVMTTESVLRSKEIPWEIYQTARLITDRDLQLLRRFDKKDPDQRRDLLRDEGDRYVQAMLNVLTNVTKDETVQYVLAMLDDLLLMLSMASSSDADGTHDPIQNILFPLGDGDVQPYGVLIKLLGREDWFTKEKAAGLLSVAFAHRRDKDRLKSIVRNDGIIDGSVGEEGIQSAKFLDAFIDWCVLQIKKPSHPQLAIHTALHCISVILREPAARPMVCKSGAGQAVMAVLLQEKHGLTVQGQYELVLCIWLISLLHSGNDILSTPALVKALVDYVRLAHKEKVIRVSLLALKSLLRESGKVTLELSAVESGLRRVVENRISQEWDDPDIIALLEWLQDRLDAGVMAMSSMERYKKEIMQGILIPGPMHDSESFWLENAERLMDNNSSLLKALLGLLDPSHDDTTLCLACRGVSNFITYYPHGKGVVSDMNGKTLVMRLMAHPDPAVQREALLCIQKLLLSKGNLSYLSTVN
jgi:V-type H+-transporting ATPase subunit H